MNKNDLVRAIANNAGLTLKDAGNALDGFIAAVTEELKKGEKIQIVEVKADKIFVRTADGITNLEK